MLAHEIIGINEDWIKSRTGFTSAQILKLLFEFFTMVCGCNISKNAWNSYDELNNKIIEALES